MPKRADSPLTIVLAAFGIINVLLAVWIGTPKPRLTLAHAAPPELLALEDQLHPVSDSAAGGTSPSPLPAYNDPFMPRAIREEVSTARKGRQVSGQARRDSGTVWVLSAIVVVNSQRAAVIDDALVHAGDRLAGGARVFSIAADSVVVMDARQALHVLRLRSTSEGAP